MSLPTLSVVVPNYNHGHFLPECLDSLVKQSVTPLEILVVDDCSSDNSLKVLEEYSRKYPVITCVRNEKNMGVNYTLNRGLNLAKGQYVFLPGADDRVAPGHFEKTLSLLEKYPDAGLCFPDPASFDHETGLVSKNHQGLSETPRFFSADELVQFSRRKRLLMSGGSVYKTSVLRQVGGYRNDLRWHSDFFATFVMAFRYGACYYPEPLYQWRATPQSYMTAGVRQWRAQREVVQHLLQLLQSPEFSDVAPQFKKSGALALAPRITLNLLAQRKYWHFISFLLLKRALPADVFWALPHWLQRIIRKMVATFR